MVEQILASDSPCRIEETDDIHLGVRVQESVYVKVRNPTTRKMHFRTLVHAVNKDETAIKIHNLFSISLLDSTMTSTDSDEDG